MGNTTHKKLTRVENTLNFLQPNMDVCLHLRGENLVSKDLISKSDPYFEVYFPKDSETPLYKSEVIKNATDPCWEPANFTLPKSAFMRHVRIRLMDKDTFTRDDLMLDCELRYPFRQKNYTFGEFARDDETIEARVCVLNDDGECDSSDDEGRTFGSGTKDKMKKAYNDFIDFKVIEIGKQFKKLMD